MASPSPPHVALFPFMSKGHTIPLLHLAQLLHRRRLATVTIFTTTLNAPFIRQFLSATETNAAVIELPFPRDVLGLPNGIESTDQLPSMSLFLHFIKAVALLQPIFEQALLAIAAEEVSLLISDGFLGWTNNSAAKYGIPRFVFYGMGCFAMTVSATVARERPHAGITRYDQPFAVPGFQNLLITRADLNPPFDDPNPQGPLNDFVFEQAMATKESKGLLVNSFYEMEAAYLDGWNLDIGPKGWCVGPLCLAREKTSRPLVARHPAMEWLDSKSGTNYRPVLYVAFGSQAELSLPQLKEIATGLERSGVDFLWVVRSQESNWIDGLESRVGERGKVVVDWVDQIEILNHGSVCGFLSHCGWNSVMEGVCGAGVPILAMPMMAEQHLNAKLVVDLGVGLRVPSCDGTRNGMVKEEDIVGMVKELMLGEKGKAAAGKAKELADAARKAMDVGGSSWDSLESMIQEVCNCNKGAALD